MKMERERLVEEINNITKDENNTEDIMKIIDAYIEGLPTNEFCQTYKLEHGSVCRYHCKHFNWYTGSCSWSEDKSRHKVKPED